MIPAFAALDFNSTASLGEFYFNEAGGAGTRRVRETGLARRPATRPIGFCNPTVCLRICVLCKLFF